MKKLLSLVLMAVVVAMCFALVGCSDPPESTSSISNGQVDSSEPAGSDPDTQLDSQEPIDSVSNEQEDSQEPTDSVSNEQEDLQEPTGLDSNEQGRNHLVPRNQTATADISNAFGNNHRASLTIDEVIRGEAALDYINDRMDGGVFQAAPPRDEDYEYLVVRITYTLHSVDGLDYLSPSRMRSYSGTFERYPTLIAANFFNDTDFIHLGSMQVNIGETVTGYMIFQVLKTDDRPMMTYESMAADGSDGLWFKLYY